MKTILITGGARGLGKALAFDQLAKGERVIVVDDSLKMGEAFLNEAKQIDAGNRAIFTQADLSLVDENERIADRVKDTFPVLDALLLCDSRYYEEYTATADDLEFSFALNYVSRFILSHKLKGCLEKADCPVLMNVCGTGKRGKVNWKDLQYRNNFSLRKVVKHSGRLNDLSAIAFASNDTVKKIHYVLYNPEIAHASNVTEMSGSLTKRQRKRVEKSTKRAVDPMAALLDSPPETTISAYRRRKKVSLKSPSFNEGSAQRLYGETLELLRSGETEVNVCKDLQSEQ